MRWERFWTYFNVDALYLEYVNLPPSGPLREASRKEAYDYMVKTAPKKYWDQLIPDYPVGCKRRVMDPGYLTALHRDNVDLESRRIKTIEGSGLLLEDGTRKHHDAIVYATGFKTQSFLAPMEIIGQGGQSLEDHWKESGGCQAYHGTTVSGFPNMAILFGPNASPAHNSVIFSVEVQVEYVVKTFFEPLLSGRAKSIVVKRSAEDYDCNLVQLGLKDSVWHSGCTNWTLNEFGRNCSNFPNYVRSFWWKLYSPKWQDYVVEVSVLQKFHLVTPLTFVIGRQIDVARTLHCDQTPPIRSDGWMACTASCARHPRTEQSAIIGDELEGLGFHG